MSVIMSVYSEEILSLDKENVAYDSCCTGSCDNYTFETIQESRLFSPSSINSRRHRRYSSAKKQTPISVALTMKSMYTFVSLSESSNIQSMEAMESMMGDNDFDSTIVSLAEDRRRLQPQRAGAADSKDKDNENKNDVAFFDLVLETTVDNTNEQTHWESEHGRKECLKMIQSLNRGQQPFCALSGKSRNSSSSGIVPDFPIYDWEYLMDA